jgi:hypothetical protein
MFCMVKVSVMSLEKVGALHFCLIPLRRANAPFIYVYLNVSHDCTNNTALTFCITFLLMFSISLKTEKNTHVDIESI